MEELFTQSRSTLCYSFLYFSDFFPGCSDGIVNNLCSKFVPPLILFYPSMQKGEIDFENKAKVLPFDKYYDKIPIVLARASN